MRNPLARKWTIIRYDGDCYRQQWAGLGTFFEAKKAVEGLKAAAQSSYKYIPKPSYHVVHCDDLAEYGLEVADFF